MKASLVLVVFVFSTIKFVVLDAQTFRSPATPLRIQMSGVCTASVIDKTRTKIATKRITQSNAKCGNSKSSTCRKTKIISFTVSEPRTKITEVCCPGYRKSGTKCDPICTVPCEHGLCTQPNFCTCYPKYRKISEYHCAPICNDCHHGICVYPNVCKCFANYEQHSNGTCLPVCKNECINSECTSPDTCSCHEGYLLSKQYAHICTPICNLPCGKGGVCHEPDVCLCARNYRVNETNQCEPVCDSCENGVCTDPGLCVCNNNYRLIRDLRNETRCELIVTTIAPTDYASISITDTEDEELTSDYDDIPNALLEYSTMSQIISLSTAPQVIYVNETSDNKCDTDCVNGECYMGYCLCNDEYYESDLIPNHCDPICEFYSIYGCVNGTCIAPNTCECYDGYIAINDHVCIPEVKKKYLVIDQNKFAKPETGIKNLTHQFLHFLVGTLSVLVLITIIVFIIYKWYNRRLTYHVHRTESIQFGGQYMAEDVEFDL